MKKITMQVIAEDLGISKMTVSRYFNGGYVSDTNSEKIEQYVKAHNYKPNFLARNLKTESNIIGIVAPKIDNHVFNEMVEGFIKVAEENDIQLLYFPTNYDSKKEDDAINSLLSMNAKGIIVDSNSITIKKEELFTIKNLISFGLKSKFKNNVFFPENEALSKTLPKNKKIKVKFIYQEYMLSTRTKIATKVFKECNNNTEIVEISNVEKIEKNVLYMCATDTIAYTIYRKFKQSKYIIGVDSYVLGIGGNPINDLLSPSLTSIHFPYCDLAMEMINMIVNNEYKTYCSGFDVIEGDSYPKYLYN